MIVFIKKTSAPLRFCYAEKEGLELKSKVLFIKLELQKYKLFLIYFYSNMTISTQLTTRLFLKKL